MLGCTAVADDLISLLAKLTRRDVGFGKSIRQAFLTIWNKEKIDQLSKKLDSYRLELNSHILMLLNAKAERQFANSLQQFRLLEQSQKQLAAGQQRILEVVTFTQSMVMPAEEGEISKLELEVLQNPIPDTFSPKGRDKAIPQRRSEKAIAAIVTLEDGTVDTIRCVPNRVTNGCEADSSQHIETATVFRSSDHHLPRETVSVEEYAPMARSILSSLYFRRFTFAKNPLLLLIEQPSSGSSVRKTLSISLREARAVIG